MQKSASESLHLRVCKRSAPDANRKIPTTVGSPLDHYCIVSTPTFGWTEQGWFLVWGLGLWVDLRGGFLAVRKGWVLVAKGGNSQRQLCKIYWLSASPACNLYLGRWSDIPNYALGRLSTIKQHLGIFFWCSYLNLSRPVILPYVSYGVSQQSPGINTIVSIVSHKTWATLRNSHNS